MFPVRLGNMLTTRLYHFVFLSFNRATSRFSTALGIMQWLSLVKFIFRLCHTLSAYHKVCTRLFGYYSVCTCSLLPTHQRKMFKWVRVLLTSHEVVNEIPRRCLNSFWRLPYYLNQTLATALCSNWECFVYSKMLERSSHGISRRTINRWFMNEVLLFTWFTASHSPRLSQSTPILPAHTKCR